MASSRSTLSRATAAAMVPSKDMIRDTSRTNSTSSSSSRATLNILLKTKASARRVDRIPSDRLKRVVSNTVKPVASMALTMPATHKDNQATMAVVVVANSTVATMPSLKIKPTRLRWLKAASSPVNPT